MTILNYTLVFASQLGKNTENFGRGSLVFTTRCAELAIFSGAASADLLSISPPRLPASDFSDSPRTAQPAELRGSPALLISSLPTCSLLFFSKDQRNFQIRTVLSMFAFSQGISYVVLWGKTKLTQTEDDALKVR